MYRFFLLVMVLNFHVAMQSSLYSKRLDDIKLDYKNDQAEVLYHAIGNTIEYKQKIAVLYGNDLDKMEKHCLEDVAFLGAVSDRLGSKEYLSNKLNRLCKEKNRTQAPVPEPHSVRSHVFIRNHMYYHVFHNQKSQFSLKCKRKQKEYERQLRIITQDKFTRIGLYAYESSQHINDIFKKTELNFQILELQKKL